MAPELASDGPGGLALDFLDTRRPPRPGSVDRLHTPSDVLSWLGARGLGTSLSVPAARILHTEAHRLRDDIAELVEAHALGGPAPQHALLGINRALATSRGSWRLDAAADGLVLTQRTLGTELLTLLAPIALAAARLVTSAEPARVRRCASPGCGAWFLDTSKGGRRRWCSMSRCGNRAKAAGHRERERKGREGPGGASLPRP